MSSRHTHRTRQQKWSWDFLLFIWRKGEISPCNQGVFAGLSIQYVVCAWIIRGFWWCIAIKPQTNRIARILAGSKKKICTKKPRFMSACAQLIIAFLLILLQLGIIVALFLMEPPEVRSVPGDAVKAPSPPVRGFSVCLSCTRYRCLCWREFIFPPGFCSPNAWQRSVNTLQSTFQFLQGFAEGLFFVFLVLKSQIFNIALGFLKICSLSWEVLCENNLCNFTFFS